MSGGKRWMEFLSISNDARDNFSFSRTKRKVWKMFFFQAFNIFWEKNGYLLLTMSGISSIWLSKIQMNAKQSNPLILSRLLQNIGNKNECFTGWIFEAANFAKCSPKDAVCAQVKAKLAAPLSFVLRLPLLIVAGEEEEEPLLTYFWSCRRRGKLWGKKDGKYGSSNSSVGGDSEQLMMLLLGKKQQSSSSEQNR